MLFRRRWTLVAAVLLSMAAPVLHAAQNASSQANPWVLRLAAEGGGDTIIDAQFTDGSTQKLTGGGLMSLEFGRRVLLFGQEYPELETEFSGGYKFDSITASNAELGFSRFTANATQLVRVGQKFRIGSGLTYHINPTLDADVSADGSRVRVSESIDNALGIQLVADYAANENLDIGIRATKLQYKTDTDDFSGNSAGVYVGFRF